MIQLWCLDCQKSFDPRQAHHCVHSLCKPGGVKRNNSDLDTIVDKQDGRNQLTSHVTKEQSNRPTSVSTELRNANPDISMHTCPTNLATNNSNQLAHSSQECAAERMSGQLLTVHFGQAHRGDYAGVEINNQTQSLNIEVGRIGSNILNSQILVDYSRTTGARSKFETSEAPPMSNMGNKNRDFPMTSGSIDGLLSNNVRTVTPSEKHHKQNNIQKDRPVLKNNQTLGCPKYEISVESNEILFINNEESRLNMEFAMQRNISDAKMSVKNIQLTDQFSKHGQIAQGMVQKGNLGNATYELLIKQTEANQRLKLNNFLPVNITNYSGTYTGSLNPPVICQKTELEKLLLATTTSGNKLSFHDKSHVSGQKQIAAKEISHPGTSESVQSGSVDDPSAVASPCSQYSVRTCPLCQKEFSSKSSMKRHYQTHLGEKPFTCDICQQGFMQKDKLKIHMLVHTGEKSYKCDICSILCLRKGDLQKHILIHTGIKPYKCAICVRAFTRKRDLKNHVHSLHKVTLE